MLNLRFSLSAHAAFILTFCGTFCVFGASGCASAKTKDEAALHARIGTALLQQGRYPDALRELSVAEKLDPKSATTENNLGLVYFMREKYQLAADHIELALAIQPTYSEARNNYGRILIELGRYTDAISQLHKVINDLTYSDPAKALVNLGLAYFRKGDYAQAKATFAKALESNRENCLAQTLYGRSLFEMSQFELAAHSLDNASIVCQAKNGPGYDEPQYYSGLAYYKLGQTSAAVSRMEDVMKLSPDGHYAKKAESLLKLMK
jgi:type IV pilus assembly protein PilF